MVNPRCDLRTSEVDDLVLRHFPNLTGVALLAVGGYGRRELFPYSDIDLLLLVDSEERIAEIRDAWRTFQQQLWDAGLRVSQSVHTVADCLALAHLELTMSLLDRRYLAGARELYQKLDSDVFQRRRDEILTQLARATRERHHKFQDSIYHLEPNLKDGPGGLRDYQTIRWMDALSNTHVADDLGASAATLGQLRWDLHLLAGRDNNVIHFDAQDELAADPAALMSTFYQSARRIYRALTRQLDAFEAQHSPLFARIRESRSRISNAEFSVVRDLVYLRTEPVDALRLFAFVARHGVKLAPDTGRRIHALRNVSATWREWNDILREPHAGLALREMHETGLLTALFPEFASIECLVIRDFYHQYTVDEHTLVAITKVLALRDAGTPSASLAQELSDPTPLILALLFHDTGKGGESEGHSVASARLARGALHRIGAPEREADTILFLIEAHLEMSAMMTTRDLSDPATAHAMADRVGTIERLKLLTLLTWADISAVNPQAMTPWRAGLLWQLYMAAYRALTHELPMRYERTHSPAEIAEHARMERLGTAMKLDRAEGVWTLTLVTPDHPFLFASAAGAISSFGLDIVKAEAFTNPRGTAIEIFTFADPIRTLDLNPSEIERLKQRVADAVEGKVDVGRLLDARPRPKVRQRVPPRVHIDGTIIQITAQDRPGLLFDLARAISREGCNIETVLIDTQAHRAIDVFYLDRVTTGLEVALVEQAG